MILRLFYLNCVLCPKILDIINWALNMKCLCHIHPDDHLVCFSCNSHCHVFTFVNVFVGKKKTNGVQLTLIMLTSLPCSVECAVIGCSK